MYRKSYKIREILKILNKITNNNPKIKISKNVLGKAEVFNLKGSNKKLFTSSRWKPKYTDQKVYQSFN